MRNTSNLPETPPLMAASQWGEVYVALIQYGWITVEEVMVAFSCSGAVTVIIIIIIIKSAIR